MTAFPHKQTNYIKAVLSLKINLFKTYSWSTKKKEQEPENDEDELNHWLLEW